MGEPESSPKKKKARKAKADATAPTPAEHLPPQGQYVSYALEKDITGQNELAKAAKLKPPFPLTRANALEVGDLIYGTYDMVDADDEEKDNDFHACYLSAVIFIDKKTIRVNTTDTTKITNAAPEETAYDDLQPTSRFYLVKSAKTKATEQENEQYLRNRSENKSPTKEIDDIKTTLTDMKKNMTQELQKIHTLVKTVKDDTQNLKGHNLKAYMPPPFPRSPINNQQLSRQPPLPPNPPIPLTHHHSSVTLRGHCRVMAGSCNLRLRQATATGNCNRQLQ